MKSTYPPKHSGVFAPAILLCCLVVSIQFSSCMTDKKISYFRDIPDSTFLSARMLKSAQYNEQSIQPGDILQISILTLDPQINNVLTAANTASYAVQPSNSATPTATPPLPGYMVDKTGFIELPMVGKIQVGGKSSAVIKDIIYDKVSVFYNKPVVSVRFANFSITVLGEVTKPATYIVPNEKINIIDAIGMAGDLTIFGKRDNILLVRDSLGQKQSVRLNLNSSEVFSSPYFYLRQGDLIYVEPAKSKIASTDASKNRNITLIASGLSLLVVLFSRL